MKLSEAIRKGSRKRRQSRRKYTDGKGTCALGAAYEAITKNNVIKLSDDYAANPHKASWFNHAIERVLRKEYPFLFENEGAIYSEIVKRNDELRQTRHEIADWLESLGY